ncbi:hypothetical protein [Gordonia sp. VNK21]|uniref:hypothetical protein n=1 Tax=Gordonia sp. VNK21 TaxID=3382483 RepID=UPI0038D3535D
MSEPVDENPARRSPALVVSGVLALLLAGWGLSGGPDIPNVNVVPWILVGLGLLVGVVLVISGFRRPDRS